MSTTLFPGNREIGISSIQVNSDKNAYIAGEEIIQAVEIAIALNKPLVVSGEPGTGKTELAHWVAQQLYRQTVNLPAPFAENALVFNTKSGSAATDLFYYYDAVSHFRSKENKGTALFIELKAMGLALALAHGKQSRQVKGLLQLNQFSNEAGGQNNEEYRIPIQDTPQSSVVLIDEIDKAPRDFPNDLLNEIEHYEFDIKELGIRLKRPDNEARIVVIMTSNSEKNLPNAFLRRCVFYHIPFPGKAKLLEITKARMLAAGDEKYNSAVVQAIDLFMEYRKKAVNKKPATSEFLDWINVLEKFGLLNGSIGQYDDRQKDKKQKFISSLNVLFKSKEDMDKVTADIPIRNA